MKKTFFRILVLLTVLAMLLGTVSCGKRGKTLLSLDKDGISVAFTLNEYQLMLSRTKATLDSIQNANDKDFWNTWIGSPAITMDQHYRQSILENCKTYLVALYLFEKEGLSLSEAEEENVQKLLDELIVTDGNGSKTKLNEVLSAYGVNYNILKDVYTMEAKINRLQLHLYGEDASLISDEIKTAFMTENYVHYKQIYLPFSKFVYETDKNGDDIYYKINSSTNTISKSIYYDVHNGVESTDTDANGDKIYYTDSAKTKIAYDTVHGERQRMTNSDGTYKTVLRSQEELEALKADKDALMLALKESTNTRFEEEIENIRYKYHLDADENTDGYYIRKRDYSAYGSTYTYLSDTVKACDEMEIGGVAIVESTSGYHIIKKYAFSDKAYDMEENKSGWFQDFNDLIINELFAELCAPHLADIKVNDEVYALAPTMKEIRANYFY